MATDGRNIKIEITNESETEGTISHIYSYPYSIFDENVFLHALTSYLQLTTDKDFYKGHIGSLGVNETVGTVLKFDGGSIQVNVTTETLTYKGNPVQIIPFVANSASFTDDLGNPYTVNLNGGEDFTLIDNNTGYQFSTSTGRITNPP